MNQLLEDTVPGGEEVVAFTTVLAARFGVGSLRLCGALHRATLAAAPGAEPVELKGPLYLVSGERRLSVDAPLFGVISWSDQGLPRMAAGVLLEAESAGLSLTLLVGDEAAKAPAERKRVTRLAEPEERPAKREAPAPKVEPEVKPKAAPEPPPPPPPAPAGLSWGAAVAASQAAAAPSTAPGSPASIDDVESGDILEHPTFGRCRVMAEPVGGKFKVRKAAGGYADLNLNYFEFTRQASEGAANVYRVRLKR